MENTRLHGVLTLAGEATAHINSGALVWAVRDIRQHLHDCMDATKDAVNIDRIKRASHALDYTATTPDGWNFMLIDVAYADEPPSLACIAVKSGNIINLSPELCQKAVGQARSQFTPYKAP